MCVRERGRLYMVSVCMCVCEEGGECVVCIHVCGREGGMSEEGKRMSVSVGGGERVVCV